MSLQPGYILNNRYRIDRQLGQGGFGAVYQAWDLHLEEWVAVKESLVVTPAAEKQFRSEANLLFHLRHPNLPHVFDCFNIPGQGSYLAMDYIEGENLAQRMEKLGGPMPLDQVLDWVGQICDALAYLHSQDPPVIHRDIKPTNIIISAGRKADNGSAMHGGAIHGGAYNGGGNHAGGMAAVHPYGIPYLVDFGISKQFYPDQQTASEARGMTLGYGPPEQLGTKRTDARADIYALGATVYHLVTRLAPPLSIDMSAGLSNSLVPPHQINPDVPESVSRAIMKAMRLNREERWNTVLEFKHALQTVVVQPSKPQVASSPVQSDLPAIHHTPSLQTAETIHLEPNVPDQESVSPEAQATRARRLSLPVILGGVLVLAIVAALLASLGGRTPGGNTPTPNGPSQTASAGLPISGAALPITAPVTASPAPSDSPTPAATATPGPTLTSTPTETPVPSPTATATRGPWDPPVEVPPDNRWIRPADGMEMVYIPAGVFRMGSASSDKNARENEKPQHPVTLEAYWIDRTEVTNAMFRRFVDRQAYPWASAYIGSDMDPVVYVSWYDALAYCQWVKGSLPSEAQWEKAARGPWGRIYPWGDDFKAANLNFCDKKCQYDNWANTKVNDGYAKTSPVNKFPAGGSPYEVLDMAGNVGEWVLDWLGPSYDRDATATPAGTPPPDVRSVRGGAWYSEAWHTRAAHRIWYLPDHRDGGIGFRCVLQP